MYYFKRAYLFWGQKKTMCNLYMAAYKSEQIYKLTLLLHDDLAPAAAHLFCASKLPNCFFM